MMRFFYDHVCGHMGVCVHIGKHFCLCIHKHMAGLKLNLRGMIYAGKCVWRRGGRRVKVRGVVVKMNEENTGNQKKRDRVLVDQNSVCLGVWAVSAKERWIIFAV